MGYLYGKICNNMYKQELHKNITLGASGLLSHILTLSVSHW